MFDWKNKLKENLTSVKWWVFCVATTLFVLKLTSEYTWLGIAGVLMGIGKLGEYWLKAKNGGSNK